MVSMPSVPYPAMWAVGWAYNQRSVQSRSDEAVPGSSEVEASRTTVVGAATPVIRRLLLVLIKKMTTPTKIQQPR